MRAGRWPALLLILALPATAAGQSFQGTVRTRVFDVLPEQLALVLGSDRNTRPDVDALFALSPDELAARGVQIMPTSTSFKGRKVRADNGPAYMMVDSIGGPITVVNREMGAVAVMSRETMDAMQASA